MVYANEGVEPIMGDVNRGLVNEGGAWLMIMRGCVINEGRGLC